MDYILETMVFLERHTPEDLLCDWRREAGIFRYLGNRELIKIHGRLEAGKIRDEEIFRATLNEKVDELGEKRTREGLSRFPYEAMEQNGIAKKVVLSVILTLEKFLRVEQYTLLDMALEELAEAGLSPEVAERLVGPHSGLKKGRRSRLRSTNLEIPVQSGQTPWPAPYVSALVFEAMLNKKDKSTSQLITDVILCLGGSPDHLARYRNRLAKILVPPLVCQENGPSKVVIIDWLVDAFKVYPKSWKSEPTLPWFYDGNFFSGLPRDAIVGLVKSQ